MLADVFAGYRKTWMVVPEGNGKTTLMAGLALYHGDYTDSANVPIAASSREQAEILYRQAEGFVIRSPGLNMVRFRCYEGYRRIKCLRTNGRIQVYAADDRTADGVIPTLAFVDELHRHRDLKLYRTWSGKLKKRDGQIVVISTAGEPGSEFEDTRDLIRRSAHDREQRHECYLRAAGDNLVLHDWQVPEKKTDDLAVVALANPRADITAARLREDRESEDFSRAHWLRFTCNIASRPGGTGFSPEVWDRLEDPDLDPSTELDGLGWLDLGWQIDTTAVGVILWDVEQRRLVPAPRVISPPVDEDDVVAAILDYHEHFPRLRGWVYDPNAGGRQMAQLLENGTHPLQVARECSPLLFIEHSQDNAPMALAATRLDEAVRTQALVHDGDRTLRTHVMNSVRKGLGGEKWRFDRPADAQGAKRAKYPIDALTGLLMGHSVAVAEMDGASSEFIFEVFG